jgi:hypothetical protein
MFPVYERKVMTSEEKIRLLPIGFIRLRKPTWKEYKSILRELEIIALKKCRLKYNFGCDMCKKVDACEHYVKDKEIREEMLK